MCCFSDARQFRISQACFREQQTHEMLGKSQTWCQTPAGPTPALSPPGDSETHLDPQTAYRTRLSSPWLNLTDQLLPSAAAGWAGRSSGNPFSRYPLCTGFWELTNLGENEWADGKGSIETLAAEQGTIVNAKCEMAGKIKPSLFPQLLIYQQSWQLAKGKSWFSLGLRLPHVQTPLCLSNTKNLK